MGSISNNPILFIDKEGKAPGLPTHFMRMTPYIVKVDKTVHPQQTFITVHTGLIGIEEKYPDQNEVDNFRRNAAQLNLRNDAFNALEELGEMNTLVGAAGLIGKILNQISSKEVYAQGRKLQDEMLQVDLQRDDNAYKVAYADWAYKVVDKALGEDVSKDRKIDVTNQWLTEEFGSEWLRKQNGFYRTDPEGIDDDLQFVKDDLKRDKTERTHFGFRLVNTSSLDERPNYVVVETEITKYEKEPDQPKEKE